MSPKFKNILVTGGAGFIGANYILYILEKYKNIQVVNYDKLTYAANLSNLLTVSNNENYQFIQGDICDLDNVQQVMINHNIDTVVHFAAESHVDRSISESFPFIQTNVVGTHVLLEASRSIMHRQHFYRFHHISTDEVYGSLDINEPAFTEESQYKPSSPYAASKASSDHLVRAYHKTHGLPATISNCSNNYGPYQHKEKLIPKVINCCLEGNPIPVYGNGNNIRDWLHVADHCCAIDLILNSNSNGACYNIGGNNEWDNLSLVLYICELFDRLKPKNKPYSNLIQYVDDRAGHDFRYAIDTTKIMQDLNWKAQYDFAILLSELVKTSIVSYE